MHIRNIKTIVSVLIIAMSACLICGCDRYISPAANATVSEITDAEGRKIGVRTDAQELTIASVYAVSVPFIEALGLSDRVKAINVKSDFWKIADKNFEAAGTVGRGTVDLEKLAAFAPDTLIHRINDHETVEAVSKLGVDVICISVESVDDIKTTLAMLGEYFGAEENAEKAIKWIEGKFAYIKSIVDTIPMSERKTALLMGGKQGRVAGADMLQSWMIEQAGGIPVVKESDHRDWINIGVEKVFEYNPDVLFCTSSTALEYTVEELYKDPAWSAMTAVKNKDIYVVPTRYDSWDIPGLSCILGTLYMLREMYPEYLSAADLEDQVDDYYRFMFGRCFDKELELDWDKF